MLHAHLVKAADGFGGVVRASNYSCSSTKQSLIGLTHRHVNYFALHIFLTN
jgi:hypothetical protein